MTRLDKWQHYQPQSAPLLESIKPKVMDADAIYKRQVLSSLPKSDLQPGVITASPVVKMLDHAMLLEVRRLVRQEVAKEGKAL